MAHPGRAPEPIASEVLDFMRAIWGLDHQLQRASKQMVRQLGLTGPQRLVIRLLGAAGEMSPGDLAHEMSLHPSTLTGILARLVDRGLLLRRVDPGDGRRAVLRLSAAGRQLDRPHSGSIEDCVQKVFRRLDARTVSAARRTLLALAEAMAAPRSDSRTRT